MNHLRLTARTSKSRAHQEGEPDDLIILDIPLGPYLIKVLVNVPFDGQEEIPCYVHFKLQSRDSG